MRIHSMLKALACAVLLLPVAAVADEPAVYKVDTAHSGVAFSIRHFVSNVPGVKVGDEVAPRLTADEVNELIEAGVIRDGMIPKVRAALDALAKGAQSAVITNLTGLQADAGTTVVLG